MFSDDTNRLVASGGDGAPKGRAKLQIHVGRLLDVPRKYASAIALLVLFGQGQRRKGYVLKALSVDKGNVLAITSRIDGNQDVTADTGDGEVETIEVGPAGIMNVETEEALIIVQVEYDDGTFIGRCHLHRQDSRSSRPNPYSLNDDAGNPANCGIELHLVEPQSFPEAQQEVMSDDQSGLEPRTILPIPYEYLRVLNNLDSIQEVTGTTIKVDRPESGAENGEWTLTLFGTVPQRQQAHEAIEHAINDALSQEQASAETIHTSPRHTTPVAEAVVTVLDIQLRDLPDRSSSFNGVIVEVSQDATVLEDQDDWVKVRCAAGEGWMRKMYLRSTEALSQKVAVTLFGNPGKGKSALGNCLVRKVMFEAGTTGGGGLTTQVSEATVDDETIVDTPGIADVSKEQRRLAASEVSRLLKVGGRRKIVFVVTEQQSRIHEEDKTTIKLVLDAAPEIAQNYGIVINQCHEKLIQKSRNLQWKTEFEKFLLDKLPFPTPHICYMPFAELLAYESNKVIELSPGVRNFFTELPVAELTPGLSKDINADSFHEVSEQLQYTKEQLEQQRKMFESLDQKASEYARDAAKSRRLGIQLQWVLDDFEEHCNSRVVGKSSLELTFRELAPRVAYGESACGKGKVCPRDEKPDCSMVDALHQSGRSGSATFFLSWVWQYRLKMVLSALQRWQQGQGSDFRPETCFLWWCFFQNNQFRILEKQEEQSTEALSELFGGQLQQVGRMLSMMDKIEGSMYLKRVWCVFELFVAKQKNIPIEIIVPDEAAREFDRICRGGTRRIKEATKIDVAGAEATSKNDEESIKMLIQSQSSFDEVNKLAKVALDRSLMTIISASDELPVQVEGAKQHCGCQIS